MARSRRTRRRIKRRVDLKASDRTCPHCDGELELKVGADAFDTRYHCKKCRCWWSSDRRLAIMNANCPWLVKV